MNKNAHHIFSNDKRHRFASVEAVDEYLRTVTHPRPFVVSEMARVDGVSEMLASVYEDTRIRLDRFCVWIDESEGVARLLSMRMAAEEIKPAHRRAKFLRAVPRDAARVVVFVARWNQAVWCDVARPRGRPPTERSVAAAIRHAVRMERRRTVAAIRAAAECFAHVGDNALYVAMHTIAGKLEADDAPRREDAAEKDGHGG